MKKLYLAFMLVLSFAYSKSQVANYSFSTSTGTFTAITGGTVIRDGSATMDSYVSPAITIPSFSFNGVNYTTAYMTSNGLLTLGGTAPSSTNYNAISTTTGSGIAICPLNADLDRFATTSAASAEMRWETVGNEIVFQWQDMRRYGVTGERFSFQVRLNTINGEIKFVYGGANFTFGTSTSYQPVIGIRTSASDYKNITVGTGTETWAAPLAGTSTTSTVRLTTTAPAKIPSQGQTYTWTPPTCFSPALTNTSAITTTTATINWTEPSVLPSVGYEYEVRTNGAAGSGLTGLAVAGNENTGTTSANITGLAAATTYNVYIRSKCSATDYSGWSSALTFTTSCNAATVPYNENFETAVVPALPSCTSRENAGTGNNWVTSSNPGYGFTSKTLQYTYNTSNAANAWFYTQGLNLTAGTSYRLQFRYGNNSSSYTEKLEVKYGATPSSADMTDMIIDYPAITGAAAATSTTDFTPSASGVYYIGFHAYSAVNQYYLYVDSISLVVTPTCIEPTALVLSNITTTAAQLDWTAPGTGSPASYEVYAATTSTAPTATTTPTVTGITSTTTNLTGLTPNTRYYVWVRSNCGGGDISAWSAVATFLTPCTAVTNFVENFDAVTTPALPSCWAKVGTTGTVNTQTTNNASAPNCLYIYSSSTSNIALVSLPPVSNLAAGTHRLRFKARASSTAGGVIEVGYLAIPTDASSFVSLQSITAGSLTYQLFEVIPGSITADVLAFRHTGSPANSVLIDDVSWEPIPSCYEPTALTASFVNTTTAQLDWTAPTSGSPSGYQVYYSTANTAPVAATAPTINNIAGSPYTITGLTSATTYYVWVRSNCGGTDVSAWSSPASFTTACDSIALPISQGFNSTTLPACWSKNIVAVQTASKISFVTSGTSLASTPQEGSGFVKYDSYSSTGGGAGSEERLITAPLTTAGLNSVDVNFYWFQDGSSTYSTGAYLNEGVTVEWSDDGVNWNSTTFFPRHVTGAPATGQWSQQTVTLPSAAAGLSKLYVAFKFHSSYGYNMFLDNVSVQQSSALPVTFVNFRGEQVNSVNRLTWTTATEINNSRFELERSSDGRNFTTIASIASKAENGNSTSSLNYNYDDAKPVAGNNYYRLKQVDKDGRSSYSNIVVISRKVTDITLSSVYPNPVRNELNIVISSPSSEKIRLVVTDLSGKIILQTTAQLKIGDNQQQMHVQQLPAGTYFIKAMCTNGCETTVQRFVKQ